MSDHPKVIDHPSSSAASILLLEGIHKSAVNTFVLNGCNDVECHAKALPPEDLKQRLSSARVLGVRSRSKITADMLRAAPTLEAIGCFSVGTDQVDLEAARAAGVPVFNAPFSNTRSVAELTIAEIVFLFRGIFPKSNAAHKGVWLKTANGSHEVRGKTLGVVGYGNIGSQIGLLAESMGMNVIYFDETDKLSHGTIKSTATLASLLEQSDVVTLHLPETEQTEGMIGDREIRTMKPGSFLINNARGSLIDLEALARALADEHLAGAAVDVFPVEPKSNAESFDTVLRGFDNVILTPHIGGSTQEAQRHIGGEVAKKLVDFLKTGSTSGSVNFPQVLLPETESGIRFVHIGTNEPRGLQKLSALFLDRDLEILSHSFRADGGLCYSAIDVACSMGEAEPLIADMNALAGTIRTRVLPADKELGSGEGLIEQLAS
ncbi:MAG: phosphoglycerate dehydrogenase [Pseudomonadota bacterium]